MPTTARYVGYVSREYRKNQSEKQRMPLVVVVVVGGGAGGARARLPGLLPPRLAFLSCQLSCLRNAPLSPTPPNTHPAKQTNRSRL